MMNLKKLKRLLYLPLIVSMIVSGSLQPAMGFTVGEEKEMGEKLLYTVRASFPLLDDPDLHQ